MAGLTKTKKEEALPFPNLTKDPTKLPIWRSYSGQNPYLVTSSNSTSQSGGTWTTYWGYYGGDTVNSNTLDSYVTVLNLTNLSNPIIIGVMLGRYSNSGSTDHRFRITVDGKQYIIDANTFEGRLCLGSLYNPTQSTTNGATGRFYAQGATGVNNVHYPRYFYDTAEQPIYTFQDGMPTLYAESSFKFEDYVSSVLTFNDYNAAYVQYQTLGVV